MRKLSAYCLAGVMVVLATCIIAAVMPVLPVSAGPVIRGGAAVQWVDRGGKSDRTRPQHLGDPKTANTAAAAKDDAGLRAGV